MGLNWKSTYIISIIVVINIISKQHCICICFQFVIVARNKISRVQMKGVASETTCLNSNGRTHRKQIFSAPLSHRVLNSLQLCVYGAFYASFCAGCCVWEPSCESLYIYILELTLERMYGNFEMGVFLC